MPLAQRSVVPTTRGVSAGVAVLIAVGCTLLGVVIDAARGTELTKVFGLLYFIGCVAAVAAVRNKALFTAMVQPPLILFVAVPLAYQFFTDGGGTSTKDVLLNVAIPLVNRFPWMLMATLATLAIGGVRLYLSHHSSSAAPARSRKASTAPARKNSRSAPRGVAPRSRAAEPATTAIRTPQTGPRAVPQPPVRSRRTPPPPPPRVTRTEPAPRDARPQHTRAAPVMQSRSDVPAHPIPQVRYRRREQPPFDR